MTSNSQLIDGKTGEPIGYNVYATSGTTGANYTSATYGNSNNYVATTTSNYVPATTTTTNYAYGSGSGAVGKEYAVGGGYYTSTNAPVTTTVTTNAQVVGTTVNTGKEVIKGESRIEYVPFEKKII